MRKIIYLHEQFLKNCFIFAKRPGGRLKCGEFLPITLATGACLVSSGLGEFAGEMSQFFLLIFLTQNNKRPMANTEAIIAPTIIPFTSIWVTLVTSEMVEFEQLFGSTSAPAEITPPRLTVPSEVMLILP